MEVFVVSQCSRFSNVTFPNDSVVSDVLNRFVQHQGISSSDDFYVVSNGRRACLDDPLQHGAIYHLEPRLCGGKGGFGSMLRALGAQIEKTTNREACRDLSGRRLRDVNHEKEMADWLKKQAEREADKEQRRLDRLQRKLAEPKHQFTDTTYQRQCHDLSERLEDSVIKGLQASSGGVVAADKPSTSKRSTTGDRKQPKKKKTKMAACFWTGMDELQSSEDEDESDEDSPSTSSGCGAVSVTTRTKSEEAEPEGSSSSPSTSPCSSSPDPVTISPPQEQVPSPPQEKVPGPPQEQVPGPPQEKVPSPPQEKVPGPPQEQVPGPPQEEVPSPPQEKVPGPPQEQVPGPPQEEVPSPPQEETCIPSESSRDHGVGPTDDPEASQTSVCSSQQQEGRSPPLDLSSLSSVDQLTSLGLDVLKQELTSRGLKCGGTLTERAARLFAVRGLTPDQIDPALLAKPGKAKKK